ncbi:APC10-domain-containing protein [Poronia punctata]|nr:APC10-domain-containing protein [Poronia punctata]
MPDPPQGLRWRIVRGDRILPPVMNWISDRRQEEESVVILETPSPSSSVPTSEASTDILIEPESGRWSLRGAGANTAGDDEEADEEAEEEFEEEADEDVDEDLDNADMNGDPAADADAETEIYEEEVDPEASVVGDAEEAEADEEDDEDEPSFDPTVVGLKEISNLASFTVSSYKPGCGVKELRDDDVNQYWQSDGPQPHRLNIHFIKRVEIRALRLFLDYELDESYTPTKIQITAGTGPNLTIPFTTMELVMPKGWIDVPIAGAGGGADGNSLCCFFVRVIILENHQNGKDTHIRGVKVYALDEGADTADNNPIEDVVSDLEDYQLQVKRMSLADTDDDALMHFEAQTLIKKQNTKKRYTPGDGGLTIPDFMREPEIR